MVQKSNITKIEELFFKYPNKDWYLKEISRKIKIAHTSVNNYLSLLISKKIIKKLSVKRGKRIFPFYKADLNSDSYKVHKINHNFLSIIESGVIDYLNYKLMPKSIVVFGSYQKGEDNEDSDIDIFVESTKEEVDLANFEKKLNRKIQVHFNPDFRSYPKELKNNIINGWVVKGYLKVI